VTDPTRIELPYTHKVNWDRMIRHPTIKTYTDEIVDQIEDIGASLGTPTIASEVKLIIDEEYRPTQNGEPFLFTKNGDKVNVTIDGPMTVQDIYNKWKS